MKLTVSLDRDEACPDGSSFAHRVEGTVSGLQNVRPSRVACPAFLAGRQPGFDKRSSSRKYQRSDPALS